MGGIRNFAYYAADHTIEFLSKRNVKLFFVVDRDEKSDPEVEKLKTRLGAQAKLVVLSKRELENHLAIPRVLGDFVRLKRELAGEKSAETPSRAELEAALDEAAEGLRHIALSKRILHRFGAPVRVDKVIDKQEGGSSRTIRDSLLAAKKDLEERLKLLDQAFDEEKEALDASWSTRKLDLVPGDILIDEACKRFGVRFKKEQDSARLASLMSPGEIPAEIRDLLEGLCDAPDTLRN